MSLSSPALTLAVPALFGNIKPVLSAIRRLGPTDFSADAPEYMVKPGATTKVPVSAITAAQAFNDSSNNYLTGGPTEWASLTCAHYLQGFDISGVNIDQGCDQQRMEQLFVRRASTGIAYAIQATLATALGGTTISTGVTIDDAATLADYMGLVGVKDWFDGALCALAVNGAEYAKIKAVCAAANIVGDDATIAHCLGFRDLVLVPGMNTRACIVPNGALGFLGRVPEIIANYPEVGVETDPDSGLSVGIVIADDQAKNKRVANADLWFGAYAISANAAATTPGIIRVGTSV